MYDDWNFKKESFLSISKIYNISFWKNVSKKDKYQKTAASLFYAVFVIITLFHDVFIIRHTILHMDCSEQWALTYFCIYINILYKVGGTSVLVQWRTSILQFQLDTVTAEDLKNREHGNWEWKFKIKVCRTFFRDFLRLHSPNHQT
jgi:hypothetical protein